MADQEPFDSEHRLRLVRQSKFDWSPLPARIQRRLPPDATLRQAFATMFELAPLAYPWAEWFAHYAQGEHEAQRRDQLLHDVVLHSSNQAYMSNLMRHLRYRPDARNNLETLGYHLRATDVRDAAEFDAAHPSPKLLPATPPRSLTNHARTSSGQPKKQVIYTRRGPLREGSSDVSIDLRKYILAYGRPNTFGETAIAIRPTPTFDNVRWEPYYFTPYIAFHLAYINRSVRSVLGRLTLTVRIAAARRRTPPQIAKLDPSLFRPLKDSFADDFVVFMNNAIADHWNHANLRIELDDQGVRTKYGMRYAVERVEKPNSEEHVRVEVYDMAHPTTKQEWRDASKRHHPRHFLYQLLEAEYRSNDKKINIADNHMEKMPAHEFGHWMGWPDEYIEKSDKRPMGNKTVVFENRLGQIVPVRIALKFVNPTQKYFDEHQTTTQMLDLTDKGVSDMMMADMKLIHGGYLPRYLYVVAHEFLRLYNQQQHGGTAKAKCHDVTSDLEVVSITW